MTGEPGPAPAGACERFEAHFGRAPHLAVRAPGRVNLIGEHTDYNDGLVLPFAIDRDVTMIAAPGAGDAITLLALDVDGPESLVRAPLGAPFVPGDVGYANLVHGVLEQFRRDGAALPALDIAFTSTIPIGAGLSSSAAIEVATALLAAHACDVSLDALDVALLCQRAEHEFAGVPCGIMDMLVIAAGRAGSALLLDCRDHRFEAQTLPADLAILVADTGVSRVLADGVYADRRETCRQAARSLGLDALRDATVESIGAASLEPEQERRALHVVTENTRTLLAAAALRSGDLQTLGHLLTSSHVSLRDLYEVSCRELDAIVDAANACEGVYGARMTGAGFGGCAIVACRPDAVPTVRKALDDKAVDIFVACAVDGARVV